jgi:hypothetical protein
VDRYLTLNIENLLTNDIHHAIISEHFSAVKCPATDLVAGQR